MIKCNCDICESNGKETTAIYDAKLKIGPWAYLCDKCFKEFAVGIKGLYTELKEVSCDE